jgi:uncharacterized protein YlxW (UPF0749 family)
MWQKFKGAIGVAWPWVVAAIVAVATMGAVRRFGAARAASKRYHDEMRARDLARLHASQKRAGAQRDALLVFADEVEARAREHEAHDATLERELASLRERVAGMNEQELRAEAQKQAARYRSRFSRLTPLVALLFCAAPVHADDVCLPRADVETMVVATAEASERLDVLAAKCEQWRYSATVLRATVAAARTAETAATLRADAARDAQRALEVECDKAQRATKVRAFGAALAAVASVVLVAWAVR